MGTCEGPHFYWLLLNGFRTKQPASARLQMPAVCMLGVGNYSLFTLRKMTLPSSNVWRSITSPLTLLLSF